MDISYNDYTNRILLLGNGFDLSYKLPTKYVCFLQTIKFIKENQPKTFLNIGEIFGDPCLHEKCKEIKDSYGLYHAEYDSCKIDQSVIDEIIKKSSNNCWLDFFDQMFNKDVGWIDFEKEISNVIKAFSTSTVKSSFPSKITHPIGNLYMKQ